MPDAALKNAKAQRKQLVDERLALHDRLTALDTQIGKIDNFIKDWHAFAEGEAVSAVDNSESPEQNKQAPSPKKVTGNSPKEEVAKAAREIILERGSAIKRDELYDLLTSRGLVIQGKDPQMVLSTMLWRMKDEIVRVKGGGYWVADVSNPELEYDPHPVTMFENMSNTPLGKVPNPDSEDYKDASEDAG